MPYLSVLPYKSCAAPIGSFALLSSSISAFISFISPVSVLYLTSKWYSSTSSDCSFPNSVVQAPLLSRYAGILNLSSSFIAESTSISSCLSIPRTLIKLNSVRASFCISKRLSLLCDCSISRLSCNS